MADFFKYLNESKKAPMNKLIYTRSIELIFHRNYKNTPLNMICMGHHYYLQTHWIFIKKSIKFASFFNFSFFLNR